MMKPWVRWIVLIFSPILGMGLGLIYAYQHFQGLGGGEGAAIALIYLLPYYALFAVLGLIVGTVFGFLIFFRSSRENKK